MQENSFSIRYKIYGQISELPSEQAELLGQAEAAAENAYAPYSEFQVGAAIELDDGQIINANNQENIAYPSGLCAERIAMFYASAQYPRQQIVRIAVSSQSAKTSIEQLLTPCGACRQVMAEYQLKQDRNIEIILAAGKGRIMVFDRVEDILPFMFKADQLKKNQEL